jgi:hypothetical protein
MADERRERYFQGIPERIAFLGGLGFGLYLFGFGNVLGGIIFGTFLGIVCGGLAMFGRGLRRGVASADAVAPASPWRTNGARPKSGNALPLGQLAEAGIGQ